MNQHRLSFSNLSQYGKTNDRLSNLRSSSTSVELDNIDAGVSSHEAVADATNVATEWNGERLPIQSYRQFELSYSTDELSVGSSQCESNEAEPASTPDSHAPRYSSITGGRRDDFLQHQYDGMEDPVHSYSPDPMKNAGPAINEDLPNTAKRKASQLSLRSLTESITKRPRTEFKKLATNVYRGGARTFGRVRKIMRRQRKNELENFAA